MMTSTLQADISSAVAAHLPYLRRYARALTGSQSSGDTYAVATLEMILADRDSFRTDLPPKVALFQAMHAIWTTSAPISAGLAPSGIEAAAQAHLAKLTPDTREALLLSTVEGFSTQEIAQIMGQSASEVSALIDIAHLEMAASVAGRILIIEDEPIIAMDLQSIVTEMGHEVTGVARTRDGAVKLAQAAQPDLILADIQLADKSSGIDAVNDLLMELGERPVIFITAFPERLLTGAKPEPAFLITKPYAEEQVRSAVGQAMFFASTETLLA